MARNRHPFEGELARAKQAEGRFRLWTGHGGEWVKRGNTFGGKKKDVFLPTEPLAFVGRVPDLAFANRVIARVACVTVRRTNARGLTYDKQTGTWWLVTDF